MAARQAEAREAPARTETPYDRLLAWILEGTLPPGAPLIEAQLAAELAVSRTPIREAIMRLEQDGLIERGDRGMQVRSHSAEEILDIYDVRTVLEALAAKTAAERHTPLDLAKLRRAHQTCLDFDFSEKDGIEDQLVQMNRAFHRALWRATHNAFLQDQMRRLSIHLARYPATTLAYPGRWAVALQDHGELIEAIAQRDGALAAEVATRHFEGAREIRLLLYEQEEDLG